MSGKFGCCNRPSEPDESSDGESFVIALGETVDRPLAEFLEVYYPFASFARPGTCKFTFCAFSGPSGLVYVPFPLAFPAALLDSLEVLGVDLLVELAPNQPQPPPPLPYD